MTAGTSIVGSIGVYILLLYVYSAQTKYLYAMSSTGYG